MSLVIMCRTALHHAVSGGHVKIANVLLEHLADPRIAAFDGSTPVQYTTKPEMLALFGI